MPWTKINLGDQHSQEMTIKYVRDNYLVCTMSGFDSSYAVNAVSTDVSRPAGLRRMDYDGSGAYSYHHANTRKILSGDASGEYELVTPVYNTGEKIYVTKMVSSPMDTSGNSFTTDLLANSTVDIFIDENRAGRSWAPTAAGGSGGLPSGYKPKCIVFCEDGTEISGQILFKSGCDDTDEGVSQAAATLEAGVISAEEGFDINLYYGPKSTDTMFWAGHENRPDPWKVAHPEKTITWFNGAGDSIKGFTGQPISDSEELAKYEEDNNAWFDFGFSNGGYATPGLAKNYLSAALPETANRRSFHPGAINTDQSKNYAVINLPSGTKASSVKIGECAYTIPEVGEKVAAKGENTFADGTYYYFIANTPTASCFGCGTYWAGIKGDGTTSGEVTATGHVLPSVKCSETELATIGDDVWYHNDNDAETGIFADLAVYNKSIGSFIINLDSATIVSTGVSDNQYVGLSHEGGGGIYPTNPLPVIRVEVGDSPPDTTACDKWTKDALNDFWPVTAKRFSLSMTRGDSWPAGSGAKILMGTDSDGNGLYSFVPFVGSLFQFKAESTVNCALGESDFGVKGIHSELGLNTNPAASISGLETHVDNKYFVYTQYFSYFNNDELKDNPVAIAEWRHLADLGGKKIYLQLNHAEPSIVGETDGWTTDSCTRGLSPSYEYVKVVATGFCD